MLCVLVSLSIVPVAGDSQNAEDSLEKTKLLTQISNIKQEQQDIQEIIAFVNASNIGNSTELNNHLQQAYDILESNVQDMTYLHNNYWLKYYSQEDLDLLSRVIYAEAASNSYEDKQLVGTVVMNRVAATTFPNTIRDVIYAGNGSQYSCILGNKFHGTPDPDSVDIAKRLLSGERYCPRNVVFQAQFLQGNGLYKQVGVHYYCYGNI